MLELTQMKEFADLLQAIAALLWPILTFVIVLMFKSEIVAMVKRLKRGKFLGQELELEKSLDQLEEKAQAAAAQIVEVRQVDSQMITTGVVTTNELPASTQHVDERTDNDPSRKIIELSKTSPKQSLMLLSAEIDKEIRLRLAMAGLLDKHKRHLPTDIDFLKSSLPKHAIAAVQDFHEVRSKIIHESDADSEDILRAIDSGLTILRAVKSIPVAAHVVYHPGVPIYADKDCTNPHFGLGVIFQNFSPDGSDAGFSIYPTTRIHFKKGMQVAWEWNLANVWGEAWYRDPDTNSIKYAWSSAGEFIGRNLEGI